MNHIVEEDTGTYRGHRHPHNGYYAGDFSVDPRETAGPWATRVTPVAWKEAA